MIKNIIAQPILRDGIVDIVALVGRPVLGQFFRAEYQHGFIAVFVVFDDRQRCEGFAEADAVRQNAAVEFFKLADDRQHCVFLEVVEHIPDFRLLEARCLIGQNIF